MIQQHGSSRLFDSGVSTLNGVPNQQGTEWRSKYLELQDLFVHEVLGDMPSWWTHDTTRLDIMGHYCQLGENCIILFFCCLIRMENGERQLCISADLLSSKEARRSYFLIQWLMIFLVLVLHLWIYVAQEKFRDWNSFVNFLPESYRCTIFIYVLFSCYLLPMAIYVFWIVVQGVCGDKWFGVQLANLGNQWMPKMTCKETRTFQCRAISEVVGKNSKRSKDGTSETVIRLSKQKWRNFRLLLGTALVGYYLYGRQLCNGSISLPGCEAQKVACV